MQNQTKGIYGSRPSSRLADRSEVLVLPEIGRLTTSVSNPCRIQRLAE